MGDLGGLVRGIHPATAHQPPYAAVTDPGSFAMDRPLPARPAVSADFGGAVTGFLMAIVLLAAVGVAAFFYFGGDAKVDIKKPDVNVSAKPAN
jgi:hypothetical protein